MTAGAANPPLTPQQLAAVVAAVELAWPPASPAGPADPRPEPMISRARGSWRFSGRWWASDGT